jgi:hemoglobin/transferrin/lactoferrin receptor protein
VLGTEADLSAYVLKLAYTSQSGKRLSFASSVTEDTGTRAAQAHPFHGAITIRPDLLGLTGGVADIMIKGLSRRTSHTLTYTDENPQGWFAPTIQLSYNKQEIDSGDVEGTNTSLSGFIKNEWQLSNGTVTAGIDFFDEKAEGKGVARRTAPPPVAGTYRGEETLKSIGLFAQARQDLGDRLSVSYGARADRQILTGADGSKHEDTGLSANAQLDYMLTDTLSLNAGYASSWGGYELGEAGLINFITPWSYAGFKTSSSQSARLGLRFDNGIWAVSGALYETKIKNLTAVLPSGGARGATSDVTTRGFDASLGYTGAQGFAKLNYTYADVEQNGNVISSTAYYYGRPVGHMIGLEAGYDFNDQWRIGGNAEIALQNDKPALNMTGYEVVNVIATYEPEALDGLSLRLDVKNLFDQSYVARSADGFGNARVNTLNEPGRSISLSASMKF